MKLNEDVILKIYNEFLNSDLESKSNLRHACPFIYRNYYDARYIEINNDILKLYFKYLLSKSNSGTTDQPLQSNSFESYQKTINSFQNLRIRNITSNCIEYFFEIILKLFKTNSNLLNELNQYYQRVKDPSINNLYNPFALNSSLLWKNVASIRNGITTNFSTSTYFSQVKPSHSIINNEENNEIKNDDEREEKEKDNDNDNDIALKLNSNKVPFRLLYNNSNSQKTIIQSILKFAMEQGFQQNINLSYDDFTYQQRMALEGIFEAFFNVLQDKFCCQHLNIIPNFIHLYKFELYNCQFNYNICIPWSPHLTTIKVIDSRIKLIIDGHQCPRLKYLTIDEEASLKLISRNYNDFDHMERLQLRNIYFFGTSQLPIFNHLKSLRLNNYPSLNVTIPTMNDLQELFIQDNQLCENIYIKPQPNLKFLRLWNFHSCLNLVNEDINFIYSNYNIMNNNNNNNYGKEDQTILTMDIHRFSTLSTSSNLSVGSSSSNSSSTSAITTTSLFSEADSPLDCPTYFPKVEYLRIGYCNDLLFIKQISQRISTITIKKSSTTNLSISNNSISHPTGSNITDQPQEKKRLRRFNLLFPNLKTLVIERNCDLVDYLKWFIPTLSNLTTLIFKDCRWGGGIPVHLEIINNTEFASTNRINRSGYSSNSSINNNSESGSRSGSRISFLRNSYDRLKGKIEEEEEEEQEKVEQTLLRSNNLQAVLQKMRLPTNLSEIIFINCSEDLTQFIQTILKSRHLSIKFTDIQCSDYQLKQWWAMI